MEIEEIRWDCAVCFFKGCCGYGYDRMLVWWILREFGEVFRFIFLGCLVL